MVDSMLAVAALIAALSLLGGVAVLAVRAFRVPDPEPAGRTDDVAALHARVAELEIAVQGLPSLWETERQRTEEQRERAERAYASARAAESRARRQREEGEAEAEGEEGWDIPRVDGDGSAPEGVPAVHPVLGRREALAELRRKALARRGA